MDNYSLISTSHYLGYALGQLEDKAIDRKLYDLKTNEKETSMEVRIETMMIRTDS